MEVGLHQGFAFSPFLFAIMMDSLTVNIRKEAYWQMMFADDVLQGEIRAGDETGAVEALEKRGMRMSRAETEYMCLNGTPLGSVNSQSAQVSHATEFKCLGSTMQSDGGAMNTEVNRGHCVDGIAVGRGQASYAIIADTKF